MIKHSPKEKFPFLSDLNPLPRWIQFIVFIHRGSFIPHNWNLKWRRIFCWFGYHKWFVHTLIDRVDCFLCGNQLKRSEYDLLD